MGQILILAVPAVGVSTALTAVFAYYGLGIGTWNAAMAFGAMLSATDPVAVVALLKELGAPKQLSLGIEGESLFNDGTAAAVFLLFAAAMRGDERTGAEQAAFFFQIALGGVALGLVVGGFTAAWLSLARWDATAQITITLVAAYTAFIVAEGMFHVSGVLAVVVLGLILAATGTTTIKDRAAMHHFWEMIEYIANTLVFVMAGVIITKRGFLETAIAWYDWPLLAALYALLHVIRAIAIAVFLPCLRATGYGLGSREFLVLTWSGLRGAVGLVLALQVAGSDLRGEPEGSQAGHRFLFYMAGITTLTLLVNGTTTGSLVRYLGIGAPTRATVRMFQRAVAAIERTYASKKAYMRQLEFFRSVDWRAVDGFVLPLLEEITESASVADADAEQRREAANATITVAVGAAGSGKQRTLSLFGFVRFACASCCGCGSDARRGSGSALGAVGTALRRPSCCCGRCSRYDSSPASPSTAQAPTHRGTDTHLPGFAAAERPRRRRSGRRSPSGSPAPSTAAAAGPACPCLGSRRGGDDDDDDDGTDSAVDALPVLTAGGMSKRLGSTLMPTKAGASGPALARMPSLADALGNATADVTEAELRDHRQRYISMVKREYAQALEQGWLGPAAFRVLTEAASTAQDRLDEPLCEWQRVRDELDHVSWASWIGSHAGSCAGSTAFDRIAHEYKVCAGFIQGHLKTQPFLGIIASGEYRRMLQEEEDGMIREARVRLEASCQEPAVTRALQTRHAIRVLLTKMRKKAQLLLEHGEMEEKEVEEVAGVLTAAWDRAELKTSIEVDDVAQLREALFLDQLPETDVQRLLEAKAEVRTFPPGTILLARGRQVDACVVVLSGLVNVYQPAEHCAAEPGRRASGATLTACAGGRLIDTLSWGSVVGALGMLTGRAPDVTAIARTRCRGLLLRQRDVFPLVKSAPPRPGVPFRAVTPLEQALCRMAALLACEMRPPPLLLDVPTASLRAILAHAQLVRPDAFRPVRVVGSVLMLTGALLQPLAEHYELAERVIAHVESQPEGGRFGVHVRKDSPTTAAGRTHRGHNPRATTHAAAHGSAGPFAALPTPTARRVLGEDTPSTSSPGNRRFFASSASTMGGSSGGGRSRAGSGVAVKRGAETAPPSTAAAAATAAVRAAAGLDAKAGVTDDESAMPADVTDTGFELGQMPPQAATAPARAGSAGSAGSVGFEAEVDLRSSSGSDSDADTVGDDAEGAVIVEVGELDDSFTTVRETATVREPGAAARGGAGPAAGAAAPVTEASVPSWAPGGQQMLLPVRLNDAGTPSRLSPPPGAAADGAVTCDKPVSRTAFDADYASKQEASRHRPAVFSLPDGAEVAMGRAHFATVLAAVAGRAAGDGPLATAHSEGSVVAGEGSAPVVMLPDDGDDGADYRWFAPGTRLLVMPRDILRAVTRRAAKHAAVVRNEQSAAKKLETHFDQKLRRSAAHASTRLRAVSRAIGRMTLDGARSRRRMPPGGEV